MLPNGCFGSSLAHSNKSAVCKACAARTDCAKIVNDRYPKLMRLLVRFSDSSGKPMAEQWLSPTDKKRLRDIRKIKAQTRAEASTFGDPAVAARLRSSIDQRANTLLDEFIAKRINPITASIDAMKRVNRVMSSALEPLQSGRATQQSITQSIASDSALSASSADRQARAVLSLLKHSGRAHIHNSIVEIQ